MAYNHILEDWWRHLGCYSREQASGIRYSPEVVEKYLEITDNWWNVLSLKEKERVYHVMVTLDEDETF